MILDETVYSPGRGQAREQWIAKAGGAFFVLMTSRIDLKDKGSAVALEGFAQFARSHPEARLVAIAWGRDRKDVDRAIARLGIEDRMIWLPLSGKSTLRDYLRSADCLLDQFVLGYFGATALEAMACGTPVIARLEREQYDALCETGAPPVRQAASAEEVCRELLHMVTESEFRLCLADEHRQWFLANHSARRWLDDYRSVLTCTALKVPAHFSESPLNSKLGPEEVEYHGLGLATAPPFPSYRW